MKYVIISSRGPSIDRAYSDLAVKINAVLDVGGKLQGGISIAFIKFNDQVDLSGYFLSAQAMTLDDNCAARLNDVLEKAEAL